MPKPDDRSDNVERLQEAVQNTIQNLHEAEEYLEEFGEEIPASEKNQIMEKNERRNHSINGFRAEIKDEAHDQKQ